MVLNKTRTLRYFILYRHLSLYPTRQLYLIYFHHIVHIEILYDKYYRVELMSIKQGCGETFCQYAHIRMPINRRSKDFLFDPILLER